MALRPRKITSFQKRWSELTVQGMSGMAALAKLKWTGARPDVKVAHLNALTQVREYKTALEAEMTEKAGVTILQILLDLVAVKNKCMETEGFKPSDAIKALELLGKHKRLWSDQAHSITPVVINIVDPTRRGPDEPASVQADEDDEPDPDKEA